MINGLVSAGAVIIMVLDGARLPLKAAEHARRSKPEACAAILADTERADDAERARTPPSMTGSFCTSAAVPVDLDVTCVLRVGK